MDFVYSLKRVNHHKWLYSLFLCFDLSKFNDYETNPYSISVSDGQNYSEHNLFVQFTVNVKVTDDDGDTDKVFRNDNDEYLKEVI